MDPRISRILTRVQKPARYTGGEYNAIVKDPAATELSMAFCFPDTYEIGMSNLGMQILYGVLNGLDYLRCERVFAPWGDMEAELRREGIPLWTLENGQPIGDCDVVAFTLGYELAYTNVLNMLDLGGLAVRAADRGEDAPLVIAGGCCAYNAEPLADFVDLFNLGEGEEVLPELMDLLRQVRAEGGGKRDFLRRAAQLPGIYVPALYEVSYHEDGTVAAIVPTEGAPARVTKRIVQNLDKRYYDTPAIVPNTEIIHDRVTLELFRGCIRGCRFCQAGYVYRPVRSKHCKGLIEQGIAALENSGYQEITLSSLSTSDYRQLEPLCDGLMDYCLAHKTNLSLPSLRADNFSMALMQKLNKVRRTGLTFAPEAGTQRLRDVINKNVTEQDVLDACRIAFENGATGVKLYFMMGLPTETDEDILGIAALANRVLYTWRQSATNKARGARIVVSCACFVPKAHTPFQWEAQNTREEFFRKQRLLRDAINSKSITYNWHDATTSVLEGVLSRGDRRLGRVIEAAWRRGARLEAWSEYFDEQRWTEAFAECGLTPEFYVNRVRDPEELLPWSMVDVGVRPEHLKRERARAYEGVVTPDCRTQCTGCGANLLSERKVCDE